MNGTSWLRLIFVTILVGLAAVFNVANVQGQRINDADPGLLPYGVLAVTLLLVGGIFEVFAKTWDGSTTLVRLAITAFVVVVLNALLTVLLGSSWLGIVIATAVGLLVIELAYNAFGPEYAHTNSPRPSPR